MHGKHEASPTAQGFCEGNLFLYIHCRGEEEREELQNCPINANKISTAMVEPQNWSKERGGGSWSHLIIQYIHDKDAKSKHKAPEVLPAQRTGVRLELGLAPSESCGVTAPLLHT